MLSLLSAIWICAVLALAARYDARGPRRARRSSGGRRAQTSGSRTSFDVTRRTALELAPAHTATSQS